MFVSGSIGCGVKEFYGLQGFKDSKISISKGLVSSIRGLGGKIESDLIIFGDGVANGNGTALAEFIEDNKLGKAVASEIVKSPLHLEKEHKGYQVWLWYIDRKALFKWYADEVEKEKPAQKPINKTAQILEVKAAQYAYFEGL